MLLCDRCDRGYHCECLNPPLLYIPIEDWFCPNCSLTRPTTSTISRTTTRARIFNRVTAKRKKRFRKRKVKRCKRKLTNKKSSTTSSIKSEPTTKNFKFKKVVTRKRRRTRKTKTKRKRTKKRTVGKNLKSSFVATSKIKKKILDKYLKPNNLYNPIVSRFNNQNQENDETDMKFAVAESINGGNSRLSPIIFIDNE
jgi:hypothetical protein